MAAPPLRASLCEVTQDIGPPRVCTAPANCEPAGTVWRTLAAEQRKSQSVIPSTRRGTLPAE